MSCSSEINSLFALIFQEMVVPPSWLPALLKEQSFLQTHAYFNEFFHNHKAHSVVALARMGASEERVRKHCKWQDDK